MMNLKSRPRCQGDMIVEEWLGDADLVCLQCGYRAALPPTPKYATREPVAAAPGASKEQQHAA
ncbi:MAG TPA: hypothetical protein VFT91_06300 [Dehalococcoidia bacterium]|nr:hypothetical protein [Dehalococcoidia bacterium]